jgi:TatD DNase family protein
MLVDIHTHKSVKAGSLAIRNLTFEEAGAILGSAEKGYFSVGIHPWYIDEFSNEKMYLLEEWVADVRVLAIGECGLDKNSRVSLENQIAFFKMQIYLSEQLQKPLIIHCVGCFNELFELKKKLQPQQLWVIHGFRGKPELAKQAIQIGCALSYGAHFNLQSVGVTPLDKLFVETDESLFSIDEIYSKIALIKKCNLLELRAGELLFDRLLSRN